MSVVNLSGCPDLLPPWRRDNEEDARVREELLQLFPRLVDDGNAVSRTLESIARLFLEELLRNNDCDPAIGRKKNPGTLEKLRKKLDKLDKYLADLLIVLSRCSPDTAQMMDRVELPWRHEFLWQLEGHRSPAIRAQRMIHDLKAWTEALLKEEEAGDRRRPRTAAVERLAGLWWGQTGDPPRRCYNPITGTEEGRFLSLCRGVLGPVEEGLGFDSSSLSGTVRAVIEKCAQSRH